MTTGMLARLAFTTAGTTSFDPLGVRHSALMPVCSRFSMICICRSTSISRSAAWTTRSTPSFFAASSAPRCMSLKKGLFSVLSTNATRGLPLVVVPPRLQATNDSDATIANAVAQPFRAAP